MNIIELSAVVAEKCQLTKTQADAIVREVFDEIAGALKKGEEVKIAGFGSFVVKERAARKGLNPATKEVIDIPATKVVGFKGAKHLKEEL
ncbi:MAG: HU family DNA-binding protein [Bacilli bacterium]|nr:HU family DNA-binding protein [Bacilli bacterium]